MHDFAHLLQNNQLQSIYLYHEENFLVFQHFLEMLLKLRVYSLSVNIKSFKTFSFNLMDNNYIYLSVKTCYN